MNVFRLAGDMSHLFAMILLISKIWTTKSVRGLSGKSQLLFLVVFLSRYLDLFTSYISIYNTCMKVIYILLSVATVYFIYGKFASTHNREDDKFRMIFIIVPALGLAFLIHHEFSAMEVLWTFSIYLESVAIIPQLQMIADTGEAEVITSHYLFFLGIYRFLYLGNWLYRYHNEAYFDKIVVVAGCIQTVLYLDFFYLYITKVLSGKRLTIPTGSEKV
ncbi:Oidioi.mRNA.OKI2018_I69.XSR.g13278.t1.cds [Oikopleura dioica]|uniref:Oidioi.mRNA.OKI2018_I69.XSR.g13278.t1.cds n=1 Tax=Oikopleura dioica TaxID=34765 RepID=A0ABN7SCI6_OIKDI|nr:Oidioi.mRNA.OKI2018_I69.XSR.g13278.t1.cds [Oikopleura dioica]